VCEVALRYTNLVRLLFLGGYLYLGGMWFVVAPIMDQEKDIVFSRDWIVCSNMIVNMMGGGLVSYTYQGVIITTSPM
jgi:hypothetical protein